MVRWQLGFPMSSGARVFIERVCVYPSNQVLVPLHQSITCPSPYMQIYPENLIVLLNLNHVLTNLLPQFCTNYSIIPAHSIDFLNLAM